ncbi:hypothetical protein Dimus_011901 [Dionaea muscipula]
MSSSSSTLFLLMIFSTIVRVTFSSSDNYNPTTLSYNNILAFGARDDGVSDSTQGLFDSWNHACQQKNPDAAGIYVPKGNFLVHPVLLEGPCQSPYMTVTIDGNLHGPSDYNEIAKHGMWIGFHSVDGLTVKGTGQLDAKGQSLWDCKDNGHLINHAHCPKGGRSMALDNVKNVEVKDLSFWNSQMFHISVNGCENIRILGVKILADGRSPNTDGIHIERSTGVTIKHSPIQTGDDCISAGKGTQNLWIEDIHCGPGHGISIGSLGKYKDEDDKYHKESVRNVTVRNITFNRTENGFRIKSWAEPYTGFVNNVRFEDSIMHDVHNPIIIDQYYCPFGGCSPNKESHVWINNIMYRRIRGTSASKMAFKFECSPVKPCTGLVLQDIHIKKRGCSSRDDVAKTKPAPRCEIAKCSHAHGKAYGHVYPKSCLAR